MNHIEWRESQALIGPTTVYGFWEDVKCFSIFWQAMQKSYVGPHYAVRCALPGFRPDLPMQHNPDAAKAFCEKMLTRWVAKRGLLFKSHIIVTDAMKEAAEANIAYYTDSAGEQWILSSSVERMIKAALEARG